MSDEEITGIRPIPSSSRPMDSWSLLATWFGAGISIAEFWAGALLVPGVSLLKALIIIIVGHIVGNALMGFVAIEGYRVGVPTMVLARRPLGLRGSYLASALNYLQLVGWTAVMNIVGARALASILSALGHPVSLNLCIVAIGFLNTVWALAGPRSWSWLEKASALLLLGLVGWLTIVILRTGGGVDWTYGDKGLPFTLALDLVIAMPVSWVPLVADYSRLSRGGAFSATFIGYFASSSLFYFVGAYTNAYLGIMDPVSIIATIGLGVPAMLIIVLSTTTTTFLDIYSAAVSFKNIRPSEPIWRQVLAVGVAGTALALFFPVEEYGWFLLLIGGAFVPLATIMIIDYYVIKRGKYDVEKLIGEGASPVRISGVMAWAAGFVAYTLVSRFAPWLGSTMITMLVAGGIYYVLCRVFVFD
jgi:NCS1 family nucleobase:cation symporter-1